MCFIDFSEQLEQWLLVFLANAGPIVGDAHEHHVGGLNIIPIVVECNLLVNQFTGQVVDGELLSVIDTYFLWFHKSILFRLFYSHFSFKLYWVKDWVLTIGISTIDFAQRVFDKILLLEGMLHLNTSILIEELQNLIAFDTKFTKTCLIRFLSA